MIRVRVSSTYYLAKQYEHEELKRNLQKHIDIYENLC